MKSKLLALIVLVVILIFCSIESLADYSFLSPEVNEALENLKEKYRVKKIAIETVEVEKEHGFVWAVILPKNDGVETEEIREAVYNNETDIFEAVYNFTCITILNAVGPTRVVYGSAAEFHPYDQPKLIFIFDS